MWYLVLRSISSTAAGKVDVIIMDVLNILSILLWKKEKLSLPEKLH